MAAFSTTSFLAGVGTVFAAVTIGFAGGALITTSPKTELNRVERAASQTPPAQNTPVPPPAPIVARAETPASPPAPATTTLTETSPAPDRVIAMTPAPAPQSAATQTPAPSTQPTAGTQQAPPAQASPSPARAQPVTARDDRDDNASQTDSRKVHEGELRKEKEFRWQRAERRAADGRNAEARYGERRKRQEIEAAANAVRQMRRDGTLQRDDTLQDVSQREEAPRAPRFFLFGSDND
jgi:outer membrane biosynthesis protein TonB